MDSAARLKHVKDMKLQKPEVKVSHAILLTTKLLHNASLSLTDSEILCQTVFLLLFFLLHTVLSNVAGLRHYDALS